MKTKISLILLGVVCASAYAGHAEETPLPVSNDMNVTAPQQSGTWSFGAEAVLLQPTMDAFLYADVYTETGVGDEATQQDSYKQVNPGYHGWFGADITYGFPGNGRDVTLAYEGLQGNDTAHTSVDANSILYSVPGAGINFTTASAEIETHYDAADLLFGQKLDVGERIRLHPFVGLRYASINEKNAGIYDNPDYEGVNITLQQTWKSSFNGIGPRFGSDAEINLGQGFSVRGRLGLSALIGSAGSDFREFVQLYVNATGELLESVDGSISNGSNTHIIPEIDGRLGLNYTYNFDTSMALGVEAGWQASNYFNVLYQVSPAGEGVETITNSNFGLQGPYARVQLDIA